MIAEFWNLWLQVLKSFRIPTFSGQKKSVHDESDTQLRDKEKYADFSGFEQVKVLLFRERFGQERRLLFDSKAVRKKDQSSVSENMGPQPTLKRQFKESSIERSFKLNTASENEYVYEFQKSCSEEKMLREMIFGSVSISYSGTTLKVHTMRLPLQIMISVVFPAPPVNAAHSRENDSDGQLCSNYSSSGITATKSYEITLAHSVPVDVPSRHYSHNENEIDNNSNSLSSQDGYTSLPCCHLSPENNTSSLPRSGSYNNLQRRLLRNKATSIEFGLQKHDSDSQGDEYAAASMQNRIKLGLSVIINLENSKKEDEGQFQDFLFAHIALIESHVLELKNTVIRAYLNRKSFIHLMYEGSQKLQCAIEDLYTVPRLQFPSWLCIISATNHHDSSQMFLQKMAAVLTEYDKKETNFFVSTLLTAVLTHHLAWVPTVIPSETKGTYSQNSHKHTPRWVDLLAQARPYNPLWVQLGDLYGALSFPFKFAKTVVTGSKSDLIMQFLQVLSYFIRCSDIFERVDEKVDESNGQDILQEKTTNSSTINMSSSKCNSFLNSYCKNLFSDKQKSVNDIQTIVSEVPSMKHTVQPPNDVSVVHSVCTNKNHISVDNIEICDPMTSASNHTVLENALLTNDSYSSMHSENCESLGYDSLHEKPENSSKSNIDAQNDSSAKCEHLPIKIENLNILKETEPCSNTKTSEDLLPICEDKDCKLTCNGDEPGCIEKGLCLNYDPSESGYSSTSKDSSSPDKVMTNSSSSSSSEEKQYDSLEEGYHSLEEVKTPHYTCLSRLIEAYDNWVPEGLEEEPVPQSKPCLDISSPTLYKSFGWSLMAGLTEHFLSDFCLQGVHGKVKEEEIRKDLMQSTQVDVLGDSVAEAVCILADTDTWSVQILSSNLSEGDTSGSSGFHVGMSSLVSSACDSVLETINLGLPPESCVIHLEDKLQELYFHSLTLAEYLCNIRTTTTITIDTVASALNFSTSDIPLLLSIATIHTPYLAVFDRWRW